MKKILILPLLLIAFGCAVEPQKVLKTGLWKAELSVTPTEILPFNFEVISANTLKIFNAEEVILVENISYNKDTVLIKMPVFEGYIKAVMNPNKLEGTFVNESLKRSQNFTAIFGDSNRFNIENKRVNTDVSGNWEVNFSPESAEDTYISKGVFKQVGEKVTGTFRTTTGDYRYLEGVMDGDIMKLSTFDGAHAFLFTAKVTDSTLSGTFYSGAHFKEPFVGKRNETFELPDADQLTYLKEGYDTLEFTFPDVNGKMVSLSDAAFKNKVVIVQIMGTWCPNCLDESRFYAEFLKQHTNNDIAFIGLAFEYAKTEPKAIENIKRLQKDAGIEYPILLAQYQSSDKEKAQEKLPMLNHVLSYPTSIYIDRNGKVRKIHTGFNGPATGDKYTEFTSEFESFTRELLQESLILE
ncbi:peroxiredoxin family protein [Lacinutrix undariae]